MLGCRLIVACLPGVVGVHEPRGSPGRGRGNTFLQDLCDTDVLIHVVDGSGGMDAQGNKTGAEHGSDPADDIEWVRIVRQLQNQQLW